MEGKLVRASGMGLQQQQSSNRCDFFKSLIFKKNGNDSQCWDTSFCAQAIYEAGLLDEFPEVSQKIWGYLERTQILSTEVSQSSPAYKYETNEYRNKFYRHISEGGWPFSTSAHGWPISDCTSEGLKGVLCLLHSKAVKQGPEDGSLKKIEDERLFKAVHVLLTYQNEDGGTSQSSFEIHSLACQHTHLFV